MRNDIVREHIVHLELRGLAPSTISARRQVLRDVAAYCKRPLLLLTSDELCEWRRSLRVRPISVRTYVSHVRAFFAWAVEVGKLRTNPAARIPVPRLARRIPRPIGELDLRRALREAPADVRLMLVLAACLGFRCCEIAALSWESVSLHSRVVIVTGKGGKERALGLSDWLIKEFTRYGVRESGYVFVRRDGGAGQVSPRRIGQIMGRHLRDLDIDATPHQGRHRFGTQLLEASGGNLRTVQEAMGHARPETTAIYTLVRPRSVAAAIAALPIPDELPEAA